MEDKKVEIVKAQENVLYTKAEMFEDIQTTLEECATDTSENEKARRDFRHKLKVLQSIFDMNLPPYDFKKDNMDDIKEVLEVYVDGNELLFGYTFFLSSNTNFDYSWNYLRKQMDRYVNFFSEAYKFINYVLADINTMKIDLCGKICILSLMSCLMWYLLMKNLLSRQLSLGKTFTKSTKLRMDTIYPPKSVKPLC